MELFLFVLLGVLLVGSTAAGVSVLYGMGLWLVLIVIYGLRRGCGWKQILISFGREIASVRDVLISFVLIGMLSAALRQCGTITFVVSLCGHISSGRVLLPAVFLICALTSLCTGSSFASAASAGLICATVGAMSGIPYAMVCGAIFSGIYVGDRMSPISSSATLVAAFSKTELYGNIRSMLRRFPLPFLATLALYAILSCAFGTGEMQPYDSGKAAGWLSLAPVALILVLSLLRVNSRITLAAAVLGGLLVGTLAGGENLGSMVLSLVTGYEAADPSQALLSGGGIVSMLKPMAIIMVASCYVGIFDMTGFLKPMKEKLGRLPLSQDIRNLLLSIIGSVLGGSQTLAVILTSLMMEDSLDPQKKADTLEDMAILLSALVPWAISWSVPAAVIGAEPRCIIFSFYLYLVPLYYILREKIKSGKPCKP